MPRTAPENSCVTCRQRKIRCDCTTPVCQNCERGNRECVRPSKEIKFIFQNLHQNVDPEVHLIPLKSSPPESTPQSNDKKKDLAIRDSVSSSPQNALQLPTIASLFHHYISTLAPWYDLNDSHNHFRILIPLRALENAALFKAIIAFAACHQSKISDSGKEKFADVGAVYHAACVRDLLAVLGDIGPEVQGDYLAATCLLRSFEILNGNTRQQQHLLGAYSFATCGPLDLTLRGLSQAGTWNYLREEITVALECRRLVRISEGFRFEMQERGEVGMDDDMWANGMSYILAIIINFCFSEFKNTEDDKEGREDLWKELSGDAKKWRDCLPESFTPFSTAEKEGNVFPSVWMLQPCHVAGMQYYYVAELLLALSQPLPSTPAHSFGVEGYEMNSGVIKRSSLIVCGLAYTNNSVAARVNAFGPLAFCGRYLKEGVLREALVVMLREFSIPTGWPVHLIIEDLRRCWDEDR